MFDLLKINKSKETRLNVKIIICKRPPLQSATLAWKNFNDLINFVYIQKKVNTTHKHLFYNRILA